MNTIITIYDVIGRILQITTCPQEMLSIQKIPEGGGYVEGAFENTIYHVIAGVPTLRPAITPSIISTTISNLPVPCSVRVNGETIEVPDGTLELAFEVPGTYPFKVVAWPYLDWEGVINAV